MCRQWKELVRKETWMLERSCERGDWRWPGKEKKMTTSHIWIAHWFKNKTKKMFKTMAVWRSLPPQWWTLDNNAWNIVWYNMWAISITRKMTLAYKASLGQHALCMRGITGMTLWYRMLPSSVVQNLCSWISTLLEMLFTGRGIHFLDP